MGVGKLRQSLTELKQTLQIADEQQREISLKRYCHPPPKKRYEYGLVLLNWAVALVQLVFIAKKMSGPSEVMLSVLTLPVSLFVADFMSAGFHKWLDSFASEQNPIWGSAATAFRIHHEFPNSLDDVTYLHNVVAFAKFMTLQYGLFSLVLIFLNLPGAACFMIWTLILLFANGTEVHRQAHLRTPSGWLRLFQRSGIFLNLRRHALHHQLSKDTDYGIINGWSNWLTNKFKVWSRVDRWVWRYFGVLPHNWIHDTTSLPPEVLKGFREDPSTIPAELLVYVEFFPEKTSPALLEILPVKGS